MLSDYFNGKRVLIVGAGGGLGSEFSAILSEAGAELALVSLNSNKLDAVKTYGHVEAFDCRDPQSVEDCFTWAIGKMGGIDICINAAGVVAFGTISELTTDVVEELFMTNTFLPIYLAKQALEKITDGAVVNVTGVIAEQNLPGMAAYGASKAAVCSFSEAFRKEARRKNLLVIDARPPHTETGLATRPIAGKAPNMPTGLDPKSVAMTICKAIQEGKTELASTDF